jgi:hypothetical protein
MPDYASILRRSVSALPDPSSDMRQAVYQRARAALARQLTAVDPPLSTREIETQHQELEDAVVRLEAEFAPAEEPAAFAEPPRKDDFLYSSPQTGNERPQPQQPMPDYTRTAPAPAAPDFEDEDDDFEEEDERSSRIPLLIGLLVVVLVVVGAGAFLYAQRETVFSFLSSESPERSVAAVDAPAAPPAPEGETPEEDKAPDRLTNGADAPAETPAPEAVAVAPSEPDPPPATDEAEAPAVPLESLSGLGEEGAAVSAEEPGTSLVEQRAIYYFQGKEGEAGQAVDGTATWAEISKDNRPAIQTTIRIPDRNVTVLVTIYKNYDEALPASHLVEVQFAGKISESAIQRVPALVLKQTEQARGQPLAGAAVPVTNELFWIALSDDKDEIARNIQLLREGSWFDIPILFGDQTRALITFEKGIPGDKVFETVMASWTPA